MKLELICAWHSLLRLLRFLVLYAGSVAALFYLLPMAAFMLQGVYESMSGEVKFTGLALLILAISAWYLRNWRREQARGATVPARD